MITQWTIACFFLFFVIVLNWFMCNLMTVTHSFKLHMCSSLSKISRSHIFPFWVNFNATPLDFKFHKLLLSQRWLLAGTYLCGFRNNLTKHNNICKLMWIVRSLPTFLVELSSMTIFQSVYYLLLLFLQVLPISLCSICFWF